MMAKRIKYKGKTWIEYKQPILKSWMFSLMVGAIWGILIEYINGWWNVPFFLLLMAFIYLIQMMYERELKTAKR